MAFVSAAEFLRTVLPELGPNEFVELRCLNGSSAPHVYVESNFGEAFLAAAVRERSARNVYVGCALRALDYCAHCREKHKPPGDAAHVSRLGAVWADVDNKCFEGDAANALAALEEAPLPPSVIVESGHWYQAGWVLDEPAMGNELPRAEQTMDAIRRTLNLRAAVPLDDVGDLPRILRLPNTLNYKDTPALPVRIILFEPARRYGLRELADAFSAPASEAEGNAKQYEVAEEAPELPEVVPWGVQYNTMTSYAGTLRRRGLS